MSARSQDERWDAAQEGAELLREGHVEEAVTELERVCLEQPDNEYALYFLGNAHYETDAFEKALKAYVTALEIQPGYLGAMVAAGHALRMMGRTEQALRMGRQALMRAKEDPDAHYLMGVLHFQRGEAAAARDHLERFLESRPELELAIEVEGMLQVLRGEVVDLPTDEEAD